MRSKWGRSRSFLEGVEFYVEWNNYSYIVHKDNLFYKKTQRKIFEIKFRFKIQVFF